jgi:hypothetical protein
MHIFFGVAGKRYRGTAQSAFGQNYPRLNGNQATWSLPVRRAELHFFVAIHVLK